MTKQTVFIDGTRTPFLKSGTDYMDLMSYQLGAYAVRGLLQKTGLSADLPDAVIMGTTISNVKTGNVARESAIQGGISDKAPCHTITMACISANKAITDGMDMISLGKAKVIVAGGTDCVSDSPIMFKKKMRKKLFNARKIKTTGEGLKFLTTLRPSDFVPERPSVSEFLTGKTMGQDCDQLAAKFAISREDQDAFALRSHQLSMKATNEGLLANEITKVEIPPKFHQVEKDNGIRGEASIEDLKRLRPAFVKPHGTVTAANASFLTDGATASLYMERDFARAEGFNAKALIQDYVFTAQSPYDELLLGPAYSISKILQQNNLKLSDIDVFEIHEAFAGQVLANLAALSSEKFNNEQLNRTDVVGDIPMDKLNLWGGSLSLGHPFGATGSRLITTAVNRLHKENGELALVAACAAGGHGNATLIKRI